MSSLRRDALRSVSDDIDFEALRFTPRFDRFLQRKVSSFDRYVERLEKICSVLFAFTFLILFMLLALGGVAALLGLGNLLLWEWLGPGDHALTSIFNICLPSWPCSKRCGRFTRIFRRRGSTIGGRLL